MEIRSPLEFFARSPRTRSSTYPSTLSGTAATLSAHRSRRCRSSGGLPPFGAGENCTKNCIKLGPMTPHYTPLHPTCDWNADRHGPEYASDLNFLFSV